MISLDENLLTLSAAAKLIPGPKGCGIHVATVFRWAQRGVRGVRLETLLVGGLRYTSRSALDVFVAATTAAANGTATEVRTSSKRQRAIEVAEKELRQHGKHSKPRRELASYHRPENSPDAGNSKGEIGPK